VHAKKELSNRGGSLALELLKENHGMMSTRLLLAQVKHIYRLEFGTPSPFSGLHCASFFGIVDVASLIEMECYDINEVDFLGCGPLEYARSRGENTARGGGSTPTSPIITSEHHSCMPLGMDRR